MGISLAFSTPATASAPGENLLPNPAFEGATDHRGVPPGWRLREGVEIERMESPGEVTSRYIRVHDAPGKYVWFESEPIPARPGGIYKAEVWFRSDDPGQGPRVYINRYNSAGKRSGSAHSGSDLEIVETEGDWSKLAVELEAPERPPARGQNQWSDMIALMVWSPERRGAPFDIGPVKLTVEGGEEPLRGQERAQASEGWEPVEIGSRRELFVDDFWIDDITPSLNRRLHHPVPREVVIEFDQPWDGDASAYFSLVQDQDRILIYYNARPPGAEQTTAVIESTDGIHFTRPHVGLYEFEGSNENNLVWRRGGSGHNFTPFLDTNPDATEDQKFKAIAYFPGGGGLGAYGSPDGIHWELLQDEPIISEGGFDSQNLAFWDPNRAQYVAYYRREDPRGRLRGIWRSVSDDFLEWNDPQPVTYTDDRREHMYTNGIQPYFRAPHLYLGLPNRYVTHRTRIAEHPHNGINDVVLMSSRDGLLFDRWEEGFIRPGLDPEVWTDRNHYPAWGMLQTSPEELSLYWVEHYRHPTIRLRRGTLRTDGFVSLHAGGEDFGEMITRPFIFSGDRLEVNYATSATGSIWFELCDEEGNPLEGFSMDDSETLYGNEIAHVVQWQGEADMGELAGQPVRLRFRLHDADLYSFRFVD